MTDSTNVGTSSKTGNSMLCEELLANKRLNHDSVNGNVLATILNAKPAWLKAKQEELPLAMFKDTLQPSKRSFYDSLSQGKTRFILECKKASPSKGLIRPDFNPKEIASVYQKFEHVAAISVLADEKFFQGKYDYINDVSSISNIPVLCKDFIYDPYQVYLARKNNADAILLMLSVLTDEAYRELRDLAHSYNMGVLTETETSDAIARALKLDAKVIGINNRNLRNLTVDLNKVRELSKEIPEDRIIISESGIYTHDQVVELSQYAKAFLVGSSLTSQDDIEMACRKLIYGENKVCGITRTEDSLATYNAGAIFNGLIFYPKSKRAITKENAKILIEQNTKQNIKLNYVGVFVNEALDIIIDTANALNLYAVQLHGDETPEQISILRQGLDHKTEIWKAIPMEQEFPKHLIEAYLQYVDRIVLDTKTNSGFGGTGVSFDWSQITKYQNKIMVAGGLNPDNVKLAHKLAQCIGLDLNSGLESAPGIKNNELVNKAFINIKDF